MLTGLKTADQRVRGEFTVSRFNEMNKTFDQSINDGPKTNRDRKLIQPGVKSETAPPAVQTHCLQYLW